MILDDLQNVLDKLRLNNKITLITGARICVANIREDKLKEARKQFKELGIDSGFGWKNARQFDSEDSWKEYIREQIMKSENPLSVSID